MKKTDSALAQAKLASELSATPLLDELLSVPFEQIVTTAEPLPSKLTQATASKPTLSKLTQVTKATPIPAKKAVQPRPESTAETPRVRVEKWFEKTLAWIKGTEFKTLLAQGELELFNNLHPWRVMLDGVTYPSVENAFQAAKTTDLAKRKQFETCSPTRAYVLGQRLPLRADWEQIKTQALLGLVRQKFSHPLLKALLLATGSKQLGSPCGPEWGLVPMKGGWTGNNKSGKALMQVRQEFRRGW